MITTSNTKKATKSTTGRFVVYYKDSQIILWRGQAASQEAAMRAALEAAELTDEDRSVLRVTRALSPKAWRRAQYATRWSDLFVLSIV